MEVKSLYCGLASDFVYFKGICSDKSLKTKAEFYIPAFQIAKTKNMIGKIALSIPIVIVIIQIHSCSSTNDQSSVDPGIPFYTVSINNEDIRRVRVDASLPLLHDTLWMSQIGILPLIDGYATFIHDLKATDNQGNAIRLNSLGKGLWKVDAPAHSTIHLNYSIEIGHDTVNWTVSSAFARAYAVDEAVFFTGRTIFIAPKDAGASRIRVHFILPKGWELATSYSGLENDPNTYEVNNLSDLWDNGNLAGRLEKDEINAGKLQVIIAGTSSMGRSIDLFKSSLTKVIDAYASDMGATPARKLVILSSVAPLEGGGETFGKSISLMFPRPPDMSDPEQWLHLLSHEIFHLWNGQGMYPLSQSQMEWFKEGFTDYISDIIDLRAGLITKTEFFSQISICYNAYLNSAGKISMLDAGAEKGINYDLIYRGGMAVAIALDIETRKATEFKKSLFDIMKKMYLAFGIIHKPYTYEDLIKVSSSVAGKDLSGFFSEYVAGTNIIPLETYFQSIGLELKQQYNETLIEPCLNATQQEKKLLAAVLNR